MRLRDFETRVPGKWVLAGEHAVLRGQAAVAMPHPEHGLRLRYAPSGVSRLEVAPAEASAAVRELLESVPGGPALLASGGSLDIESTIPVGAGLGSSGALCVAITRWVAEPLGLPPSEWAAFATGLEDRFHGKSSGMDVAVILAGAPIRFVRGLPAEPLAVRRLPRFTFHDTGLRAATSRCVTQVQQLGRDRPDEARRLDGRMGEAARMGIEGLRLYDAGQAGPGLELIAQAMTASHECFEGWALIPPEARELRQSLLAQGALGAKLTGAGGGGMVVALWAG